MKKAQPVSSSSSSSSEREVEDEDGIESESEDEADVEYTVEAILDHRTVRKRRQFLIKWKGYSVTEASWENEDQLSCPDLLAEYWERHDRITSQQVATPQMMESPVRITGARMLGDLHLYTVEYDDGRVAELKSRDVLMVNPALLLDFVENRALAEHKAAQP
jgi:hypothetical protein